MISNVVHCNVGEVALLNGYGERADTNSGLVALCVNGVFVHACDRFWSHEEARVACRNIGYSSHG